MFILKYSGKLLMEIVLFYVGSFMIKEIEKTLNREKMGVYFNRDLDKILQ